MSTKHDIEEHDEEFNTTTTSRRRKKRHFDIEAWWDEGPLGKKILAAVGIVLLGVGFFATLGLIVMLLWNWLMPDIFGLTRLNYLQSFGLLMLCSILFKDFELGQSESERRDKKRRRELRRYLEEDREPYEERGAGTNDGDGEST